MASSSSWKDVTREMHGGLEAAGVTREETVDFSGVNGKGFLYLKSLVHQAQFQLTQDGASGASVTTSLLDATRNEPASNWGNGVSGLIGRHVTITSDIGLCADIPSWDPALAVARPFIFAVQDRRTGVIVTMGAIGHPGGEDVSPDHIDSRCNFSAVAVQPTPDQFYSDPLPAANFDVMPLVPNDSGAYLIGDRVWTSFENGLFPPRLLINSGETPTAP